MLILDNDKINANFEATGGNRVDVQRNSEKIAINNVNLSAFMNLTTEIKMVELYEQFIPLKEEIFAGWEEVIRESIYIKGPKVAAFEQALAAYLHADHVIGCANGTDALLASLMTLDIKPGDEVITTPFTFVATAESIALLGAKPVFVDINPLTYTIDTDQIADKITAKTKGIIPVHLYGQCAHMEPLLKLAWANELWVIEDNAQAIGAKYFFNKGKVYAAGTMGNMGTTSFYPSKNLGAYGDAGAIFTNSEELATKCRSIIDHGQRKKYLSDHIGVNSRLDALQAVVLSAKLKRLDGYNMARRSVAAAYDQAFKNIDGLHIPHVANYGTHVYHQYTLRVEKNRDVLRERLAEQGIPTMIYYPNPLHLHRPYNEGYQETDFPHAEAAAKQTISLPIHSEMNEDQLGWIIDSFIKVYMEL